MNMVNRAGRPWTVVNRVLVKAHAMRISACLWMGHQPTRMFRPFLVFRVPNVLEALRQVMFVRRRRDFRMMRLLDVMDLGLRDRMGCLSCQRTPHDHDYRVNSRFFRSIAIAIATHSPDLSFLANNKQLTAING
ncbi:MULTISPECIES: hypothetical protein [unclassified Paraburkholderia]|uniref:hypothetical protein n=1 Tax=unclassified Paraburkholderia TaxID=2615204 RepID=UPI002AB025A4|nr:MULTISPECIES: hypothetical protein [unclassified Paraburkholderia]